MSRRGRRCGWKGRERPPHHHHPKTSVLLICKRKKKRIISAFVLTIGPATSCLVIFSDYSLEQPWLGMWKSAAPGPDGFHRHSAGLWGPLKPKSRRQTLKLQSCYFKLILQIFNFRVEWTVTHTSNNRRKYLIAQKHLSLSLNLIKFVKKTFFLALCLQGTE